MSSGYQGGGWGTGSSGRPSTGGASYDAGSGGGSGWSSLWGGGYGASTPGMAGEPQRGDRGYRRNKWAAVAGSVASTVYRASATAVTEIRETYAQQRTREMFDTGTTTIPGSFPNVAITVHGDNQLIIFPSYAKHHVRGDYDAPPAHTSGAQPGGIQDQDYWRNNWERDEDEHAIVDVDVRGWVYSPHKGQLTRKNRILLGLARHLSGVPAPRSDNSNDPSSGGASSTDESLHSRHDQERIAKQAAEIERKGQQEKQVAGRGDYSEMPKEDTYPERETIYRQRSHSVSPPSLSPPASPTLTARTAPSVHSVNGGATELTDAELAVANANLMARIAPFLTTPFVQLPVSVFFYNESQSKSKTIMTNEAGHFVLRASLDFVPTHVRVLANERLSAIQEIQVTAPRGVSVISDIDDTVKRSNILAGTKEIFRNTFVRELADLTVGGVGDWYQAMHRLGVAFHYCSNSPWQLFPVLASFFWLTGMPSGSLHLKQYTGMLQGIFEPVAERKRSTLLRLLKDFPQRRFLLVGDSGEADLEVYTELAVQHPGRVLGIFIRDVTTPEQVGFFSASTSFDAGSRKQSIRFDSPPPEKPPRPDRTERTERTERPAKPPATSSGPVMGTLVDLSDEPEEAKVDTSAALAQVLMDSPTAGSDGEFKPKPPPRPSKPAALRGKPSDNPLPASGLKSPPHIKASPPDPSTRQWKPTLPPADRPSKHPLSQVHSSSEPQGTAATARLQALRLSKSSTALDSDNHSSKVPPPPPPARRRPTPSSFSSSEPRLPTQRQQQQRTPSAHSDNEFDSLPPPVLRTRGPPSADNSRRGSRSGSPSTVPGSPMVRPATAIAGVGLGPATLGAGQASMAPNKKVDLWRQRLQRAEDALHQMEREGRGRVALYTWRNGWDVVEEAMGIIRAALEEDQRRR